MVDPCVGLDAPNIIGPEEARRVSTAREEGKTGSRFFVQVRQSNRKVVHAGYPSLHLSVFFSLSFPRLLFLILCLRLSYILARSQCPYVCTCVYVCVHPLGDAVTAAGMSMHCVCVETSGYVPATTTVLHPPTGDSPCMSRRGSPPRTRYRARWRRDWQRRETLFLSRCRELSTISRKYSKRQASQSLERTSSLHLPSISELSRVSSTSCKEMREEMRICNSVGSYRSYVVCNAPLHP